MKMIIVFFVLMGCSKNPRIDKDLLNKKLSKTFVGVELSTGFHPEHDEEHMIKVADGTRVFFGDKEPTWPLAPKRFETVEGIDSDKDGLRDDVEIYINENFKDENKRNAAIQYAKAQQVVLENTHSSSLEVKKLWLISSEAKDCFNYFYNLDKKDSKNKIVWPPKWMSDGENLIKAIKEGEIRLQAERSNALKLRGGYPDHRELKASEEYKFCNFTIKGK